MLKKYPFFVTIIVIGFISLSSAFSKYEDLLFKNRNLKSKMKQVIAENNALIDKQHKLQTDPVYAESIARQKLNVAKEGEVIYKVLPEE